MRTTSSGHIFYPLLALGGILMVSWALIRLFTLPLAMACDLDPTVRQMA